MNSGIEGLSQMLNALYEESGLEPPVKTETTDKPFDSEYGIETPETAIYVKQHVQEGHAYELFVKYSRLLKAYLSDNDSRYVMDVLIQGLSGNTFYKANAQYVVADLMTRSSQIRAISFKANNASSEALLSTFSKLSEVWAAEDILKIHYGHFLPAKVAAELMDMQERISGAVS